VTTSIRTFYYEKKSEIYILEKTEKFDAIIGIFKKKLLISEIFNLKCPVFQAVEFLKQVSRLPYYLKEL